MQYVQRVLHIVGVMNRGGQESFIMNAYRNIDRSKVQFDFVVHSMERGDFDQEIEDLGGYIYRIPPKKEGLYRYCLGMMSVFNSSVRYNNIHIHTCSATVFIDALLCKINYRSNIIIHCHSNYINDKKARYIHYCLRPFLNQLATVRLACSNDAAVWGFGKHNINKVKIVKNGIELEKYTFNLEVREQYREDLNFQDNIVIGHIGRFDTEKNHSFLIQLFKELYEYNSKYRLVLVGTGVLEKEVRKLVLDLELSDVVHFLGVRDDIENILQAMDIFVFPSLFEGLGIVAIEAQAAGLPTFISSNLPLDLNITDSIHRINLNDGVETWRHMINSITKKNYYSRKKIIETDYDIKSTVHELYKIYLPADYEEL